ncbi:hypothetical protein [Alienimonas californiensis]|uniref:Uncharacterized protein n=1 Tax=Alienimonas californiensis TaxID=2527989 RepID=A0A517P7I1_9PLAN|nr:hypothetical protein [Alienimonas californiensis]QDT15336.1 hypothetical protein CA12_14200 [Alienimonas californiensis]
MTLAPPSARGRDDAYRNDSFRDDEDDDGSVAMFAPSLPPRRRSDAPRYAPRPEPAPAAPVPAPPARPSSPLAELFAEEEADAAAAAAAASSQQTGQQTGRRGEERRTAEPVRPSPSPAVTMRTEPRTEVDEPSVAAEPIWVGVARGVAAALSAGALAGAALALRATPAGSESPGGPAWLADLAPLPDAALAPLLAFCGTALGLFAVKTNLPTPPRWGATLAAAAVAGGALKVAVADGLAAGFGPSLAWQIAVCAGLILAATRWSPGTAAVRGGRLAPLIGLLVCGLTFPLADGALSDLPTEDRGPSAAGRAIAGWWTDAVRFEPPDGATDDKHASGEHDEHPPQRIVR